MRVRWKYPYVIIVSHQLQMCCLAKHLVPGDCLDSTRLPDSASSRAGILGTKTSRAAAEARAANAERVMIERENMRKVEVVRSTLRGEIHWLLHFVADQFLYWYGTVSTVRVGSTGEYIRAECAASYVQSPKKPYPAVQSYSRPRRHRSGG